MSTMPGPERGTRPFLPLVTFPMCLSGSSLCFGFTSCCYPSPSPTTPLVWNSSPSSPTFRKPPLTCSLSLLPSVVWEERTVPEASAAWPAGGAAAEAHPIPSVVAEHGEEVSDGGREQRPADHSRASGHFYMWADNTTTHSCVIPEDRAGTGDADSLCPRALGQLMCDFAR